MGYISKVKNVYRVFYLQEIFNKCCLNFFIDSFFLQKFFNFFFKDLFFIRFIKKETLKCFSFNNRFGYLLNSIIFSEIIYLGVLNLDKFKTCFRSLKSENKMKNFILFCFINDCFFDFKSIVTDFKIVDFIFKILYLNSGFFLVNFFKDNLFSLIFFKKNYANS